MEYSQTAELQCNQTNRTILLYIFFTLLFTWLFQFLPAFFYMLGLTRMLDFVIAQSGYLVMYCPGLAALFVSQVRGITIHFGLGSCKAKYLFWAVAFPVFYLTLSYVICGFLFPGTPAPDFSDALLAIPINLFFAFGEELGWRGLLAPAMTERFGYVKASLLVGLLWGVWHLTFSDPFWLERYYYSGATPVFILSTIVLTFLMNALCLKAGSMWPAVFVHGIHNYISSAFSFFSETQQRAWLFGEAGIITLGILILIDVAVIKKLKTNALHSIKRNKEH